MGVVESIDDRLKKQTVGLVTLEDFQKTRNELEEEQRQVAAKSSRGWVLLASEIGRGLIIDQAPRE